MTDETFSVPCPICHKQVEWSEQSPYRPFCSKRCQLIDLGEIRVQNEALTDAEGAKKP